MVGADQAEVAWVWRAEETDLLVLFCYEAVSKGPRFSLSAYSRSTLLATLLGPLEALDRFDMFAVAVEIVGIPGSPYDCS